MFPVFLDVTGKRVVVVGGGPVGQRKAAAARAAGAAVTIIDPEPPGADAPGSPEIVHIAEPYRPEHLAVACLVSVSAEGAAGGRAALVGRLRGWRGASAGGGGG